MKDLMSLQMQAMHCWLEAVETGAAVLTTIGARLPMLAVDGVHSAEGHRMVAEKFEAATQGVMDAAAVAARFAGTALLAPPTAQSMARAGMAMAQAAMRPATRTVRANAKRLSGPCRPVPAKG